MSKFIVDLLSGNVFLFAGDFSSGGTTPITGNTYPSVNQFSELPLPASDYIGQTYLVRSSEGDYVANIRDSGLYFSNGVEWEALPTISKYFNSTNFQVFDDDDNSKGLSFITSGITGGNFRKLKVQNSDGTIAYLYDVNLKLDTSLFNIYSGNTDTKINSKLTTSLFNTYSGNTQTEINRHQNYLGNGIISGFTITINTDTTKINISSGIGYFVNNYSNYQNPVRSELIFTGKTGQVLQYLTGHSVTYLAINSLGNVEQRTNPFTDSDRRDYLLIGAAIHSNKTVVNAVNNLPDVALDSSAQLNDLFDALKNFNKDGNVFSPNGNNLFINKSFGYIFKKGSNFSSDVKNPHVKDMLSLVAPANIRYRLSDGTEYVDTNQISLYYESAPGVRTALPLTDFSIQRIVLFPSNLVRIQYGQSKYNTMALAKQAIFTDPFIFEQNMSENGLLRALLIVAGRTSNLSNIDDALFIEMDKFGNMPLGSVGSTTTLQQAYNNSLIPQIVTTNMLGALTIKSGMSGNTDSVVNIQNTSGITTVGILGEGTLILPKTSGIGIKVDNVSPTYGWKDLIGNVRTRTGGGTVPVLTLYRGGIYQYSFGTAGGNTEIINEYHVTHDYVPNSDMFIHAHWSTILAPTGDVNWMFEVTYAKGYNQEIFPETVTIPVVQTSSTAFTHRIAEVRLSAPAGLISSIVNVSITSGSNVLTSASALFSAADIGRTVRIIGAGVGGANLDTTISTFSSSTSVTTANNASTTITTQPNFRYRVLDSNKLEIDGLILARTWRDSARTADTLNVAPFLHFVDIHYQSTNMPTKDKNYPFYT